MIRPLTGLIMALLLAAPALAAPVKIVGTDLSIELPKEFVPMPRDVLQSKYSRGGPPPMQVFSTPGPSWDVNIAVALRDSALPKGDLNPSRLALEKSIQATPGFRWVKHGVEKVGGREWIVLQFWVDGLDTPIYNHLRVTRQGEKTLLVSANMTKAQYPKWAKALDTTMQSMK
ncbi:hypothetical protein [Deinococcus arenicola]|uniref:DUF1795 domain-containing protein n=1 Tax=Deinococcus arenicola TaxID=2994950 RepID=A0ABU4DSR7_9DEIO|nr:hypothetical protein [Deinococcus sp. ZS9-10]MDV6375476.1 hypothetical protein [Deinococcus sp. ZS9-10]